MPRRSAKKPRRGQRDLSLPYQEWRFEVGEPEAGERLDAFLATRLDWRSRTLVQRAIEGGAVQVLPFKDPQQAEVGAVRAGLKLRRGQEVVVRFDAPGGEEATRPPQASGLADASELQIVYEDEHILAINKPPGIAVHPSKGHLTGSLIHLIHERHRALHGDTRDVPTLCHRLDRETSGLILCAKDQLSRTRLGKQFERRSVKKVYLALVVGEMAADEGVVDAPIGPALTGSVRLKMGVREDGAGQAALTRWRVRERRAGRTLVELHPETGRQHQLRVHMAHLGHPIVGDKLYLGGDELFARSVEGLLTRAELDRLGLDHQALHAWRLTFEHPFTGFETTLSAPLWPTIAALNTESGSGGGSRTPSVPGVG
jgi:23S rRNA pseudouridine1911/1915/1917 synthase